MPVIVALRLVLLWSPIVAAGEFRIATVGDDPPFNFVKDAASPASGCSSRT